MVVTYIINIAYISVEKYGIQLVSIYGKWISASIVLSLLMLEALSSVQPGLFNR